MLPDLFDRYPLRHSNDGDDILLMGVGVRFLYGTLVLNPLLMMNFWPVVVIFSIFWGPVWVCFLDFLLFFCCIGLLLYATLCVEYESVGLWWPEYCLEDKLVMVIWMSLSWCVIECWCLIFLCSSWSTLLKSL